MQRFLIMKNRNVSKELFLLFNTNDSAKSWNMFHQDWNWSSEIWTLTYSFATKKLPPVVSRIRTSWQKMYWIRFWESLAKLELIGCGPTACITIFSKINKTGVQDHEVWKTICNQRLFYGGFGKKKRCPNSNIGISAVQFWLSRGKSTNSNIPFDRNWLDEKVYSQNRRMCLI